jgi:hypothetical protein
MMLPTASERVFAVASSAETPLSEVTTALREVAQRADWAVLHLEDGCPVPIGCDALVGIVDGEIGVPSLFQKSWESARDFDLPRVLLAVRSANGRADFDELVAIARKALEPDAVVRYLPLYREDGVSYEGLYDALRAELTVSGRVMPADVEHRQLTTDTTDVLVDVLAHAGLTDAALDQHRSGMPVSLPALEQAWASPHITPMLPADDGVAGTVLAHWLGGLPAAATAVVCQGDETIDAVVATEPVGVGIMAGAARVWGAAAPIELEVVGPTGVRGVVECRGPLCRNRLIEVGDTLRQPGSRSLAFLPSS